MSRTFSPHSAVLSAAYCADQAELCDLLAGECADPRLCAEWRLMAEEWRAAADLAEVGERRVARAG